MNRQPIEKVKKKLFQRKVELEKDLAEISSESVGGDQVKDQGDQALSLTMEALQVSFQDAEYKEYKRIIRALEKIQEGTYGVCVDCGQSIAEKRLQSYPDAARCVVCQEVHEEKAV